MCDKLGDNIRYANDKGQETAGQSPDNILDLPTDIENLFGVAIYDPSDIREYEATPLAGK
jgi:hypothetical protein